MNIHPEALDRIVEAEPFAAVRDTYARFAMEDRPGDPWEVEFDARDEPARFGLWIAVVAVALIGLSLIASVGA